MGPLNSGAGNGRANFMGAWKMRSFCRKNHVHKILLLGGGWGGGVPIVGRFMGSLSRAEKKENQPSWAHSRVKFRFRLLWPWTSALRVKDVRTKNFIFLHSEPWVESFGAGTSAWISARTFAGYPAQKLYQQVLNLVGSKTAPFRGCAS